MLVKLSPEVVFLVILGMNSFPAGYELLMLQKIAVNLRKKRVDSGALRIDQPKICFQLDKETWMPKVQN